MTPREVEVLSALERLANKPSLCSRVHDGLGWSAPIDFGGHDGSHHSATATRLAKRGLVDRYKYCWDANPLNNFKSRAKGSCSYRITQAGIDALASHKEEPK